MRAEQHDRLSQVLGPGQRIAYRRAPWGQHIVHAVDGVLGNTKHAQILKKKFISAGASLSGTSWKTMGIRRAVRQQPPDQDGFVTCRIAGGTCDKDPARRVDRGAP
jgi:hypothetical protein